jgi:hypothetical protein
MTSEFLALEDNPVSNHMFSWATSRYEDRLLRFTLTARSDARAPPQKIDFWNHGLTKSRFPLCGEIGATARHIQCDGEQCGKDSLVKKRHDRVSCVIGEAAENGLKKSTLAISDDKRIDHVCHLHDDDTQNAVRPDLVWDSTNEDGILG